MASWPQCQRFLEQEQVCDLLIQQHQFLFSEAAELLAHVGFYLRERALYSLAEFLYQRALSIWYQQATPDSGGKAQSLNNLARLLY